jgi:DNA-binding LacI/PurR family transcriptional regulator
VAAAGRRPGPVSIRDVAAAAGVSYQTVSRVINDHPHVTTATRQRVRAAIEELCFRPNRAAQALAGGPVRSLTVVTPDTSLYGPRAALQAVMQAARLAGFCAGIQVVESVPGSSPDQIADAIARSAEFGGAAIVIAWDDATTRALAAVPPQIPVAAMVEAPAGDEDGSQPQVWIDDRHAAGEATRYLLSLGHATVHYLGFPHWTGASPRQAGWKSALEAAGASVPGPIQGGWTARSGYAAARGLAAEPEVTAVLCGNDDIAVGATRAMHEAGRAIPQEVSIIGFDDVGMSRFLTPSLTTVRLDFTGLALSCFALLQAQISGDATVPNAEQIKPQLVVRESAGVPD